MRVIKNKETNTTLTRHTDIDGGMWFTINSNDEFQYIKLTPSRIISLMC